MKTWDLLFNRIKQVKWRTRKTINKLSLISFVIVFSIAFFIPSQWYSNFVFNNTAIVKSSWVQLLGDNPALAYSAEVTSKTDGVFSAANPVYLDIKVFTSNATNFDRDYTHIYFVDNTGGLISTSMNLTPLPQGGWGVKGAIMFFNEGEVWMVLGPNPPAGKVLTMLPNEWAYITRQSSIVAIGAASDTLTLQLNSFAVKISIIFGSFSILLLPPMLEAILIPEKQQKQSNDLKNESHEEANEAKPETKKQQGNTREQDRNPEDTEV